MLYNPVGQSSYNPGSIENSSISYSDHWTDIFYGIGLLGLAGTVAYLLIAARSDVNNPRSSATDHSRANTNKEKVNDGEENLETTVNGNVPKYQDEIEIIMREAEDKYSGENIDTEEYGGKLYESGSEEGTEVDRLYNSKGSSSDEETGLDVDEQSDASHKEGESTDPEASDAVPDGASDDE